LRYNPTQHDRERPPSKGFHERASCPGQRSARPGWFGTASARLTGRFCVVFILLIVLFSSITSTRFVGVVLHDHLTRFIATLSARVLALFGTALASGQFLSLSGFGASIEGACDGVQPTYIYVAAIPNARLRLESVGADLRPIVARDPVLSHRPLKVDGSLG